MIIYITVLPPKIEIRHCSYRNTITKMNYIQHSTFYKSKISGGFPLLFL